MPAVIDRNATPDAVKSDTTHAPRLLDQVRDRIRVLHYSRSTEKTYLHWIVAFIRFHKMRHPKEKKIMAAKRKINEIEDQIIRCTWDQVVDACRTTQIEIVMEQLGIKESWQCS